MATASPSAPGRRDPPQVDCPACGRKTAFAASNPWRPFCSQRCKSIDLGAWASNSYVIAGNPQENPLEQDADAPAASPGPSAPGRPRS